MHASVANNNKCLIIYSPMFHPHYTLYDRVNYIWIHNNTHNCCHNIKPCIECHKQMNNYDEKIIVKKILTICSS